METRRVIGEVPGSSGSVDSRRPASDRLNRATVNRGAWMIIMAMPIVTLAQASRSYISRMLRNGVLVLLVGVCLGTVAAHAQDATWLLSPGSGNFDSAANWSPSTVPTGTATFGLSTTTTITFSSPITSVGTLVSNAGAPAYSFNLSASFLESFLDITGNGIVNNSSNRPNFSVGTFGQLTFEGVSSTAANSTITNSGGGAGTSFFSTSTAANSTITNNSGGDTVFFNSATGGQARFITNSGGIFDISRLTSGGMTAGSIEGAGTYQLGSKALTVGLNNLSTEVSGTIVDGGFSGGAGGALIKVGTGTLTLTGANTYSGGTSFNGGILAVNTDSNLGTGPLSFNGGTLEALAASGGMTSSKAITLNAGGGTFLADAGTTSNLSGAISGAGSFTKNGTGRLTLTGSNTYSGGTTISAGTLQAGSSTAM
jgi:autotransporter-associated beta strand protein